jgi:hypothetical protein
MRVQPWHHDAGHRWLLRVGPDLPLSAFQHGRAEPYHAGISACTMYADEGEGALGLERGRGGSGRGEI